MSIIKKIALKLKQRFCNHELRVLYCSHYPTIHCTKCGKYLNDNINSELGEYVDKITDNKLRDK